MEIPLVVEVDDKIVEVMGLEKVKSFLQGWVNDSGEEFLKEQHEDDTGEWIET